MDGMGEHYKKTLVRNIRTRMIAKDFSSPEALAKHCYWLSGKKKGKKISERQIRYVLEEGPDKPVPSADVIAAIAVALGCDVWELYFDEDSMRERLVNRLFPKTTAKVETITPQAKKIAKVG
jgi:hypothetical protein